MNAECPAFLWNVIISLQYYNVQSKQNIVLEVPTMEAWKQLE
jgi:hypothetical protein